MIRASAPGKLLLTGEYAVLEGAPAIVLAVGRRATAELESVSTTTGELRIANGGARYGFRVDGAGLRWQQDPGAHGAILEAAFEALDSQGARLPAPFALTLDSREFHDGDTKLGLGSSAAVTVAACACLQVFAGHEPTADFALAVHRELQNGRGSGADVCSSFYGGTVAFERHGDELAVAELDWPAGVGIAPVWTGAAASTTAMLAALDAFRAGEATRCAGLFDALERAAVLAVDACAAGDTAGLLAAISEYAAGLRELDRASGIGIWSPAHTRLGELAAAHGLVYKPSGAGGGDFGVAFGRDPDALTAFTTAAGNAGYAAGGFATGARGLELTQSAEMRPENTPENTPGTGR